MGPRHVRSLKNSERRNLFAKIVKGHPVAHMVGVNTRETERFYSLIDSSPSTLDPRAPSLEKISPTKPTTPEYQPPEQVCVEDANCGQLSVKQKAHLDSLLHHFISGQLFPTDLKRVPACVDGELSLPLIDEPCISVAEKQRRFSPQEISMNREEIHKLNDRGIIRPSKSPWAAKVLCVKKKDGIMRLCVDWRRPNSLLVIDSDGLGDMQSMLFNPKGKRYFTQIDLASGFHHHRERQTQNRLPWRRRTAMGVRSGGFRLNHPPGGFYQKIKDSTRPARGIRGQLA